MQPPRPIRKLLVANRGEIALRVIRGAHEAEEHRLGAQRIVAVAQGVADEHGLEGRLERAATVATRAASEGADLLVVYVDDIDRQR